MRLLISTGAAVLAFVATSAAQDTTVKSRTRVDVDDGRVVSLTGCLRHDLTTDRFTLDGRIAAVGDEVTTKTKVKTDVDRDGTKTTTESRTEAEDAVGTSGTMKTFDVAAGDRINLTPHVGRHVQVSAVVVDPDHKDAEVKVRTETTVDPDDARDATSRSKTKIELERDAPGQYTVVSVTPLGTACPAH